MTDFTPILNIAEIASNQNQKEVTINTAVAILEAAFNDANVVDVSAGNHGLTVDEYTKYFMQRVQGASVSRNLDTPAPSGTYLAKRFFIVSNEGTANVVVRPGGSGTGTITVPAAKIMLIQSDGTTLRAVSSGASLLTDLSDVDVVTNPPADSNVLKYNGTSGKWEAGNFSSSTFLGLSDTPSSYTGKAFQFTRVNSGETALEFVDIPFDVGLNISGKPGPSQTINLALARTWLLPVNLTGSQFIIGTNPTAIMTFNLFRVRVGAATSLGSVAFSTSGVPTVTFASPQTFLPGDILRIVAPSSQDTTGADVSMTFLGQLN